MGIPPGNRPATQAISCIKIQDGLHQAHVSNYGEQVKTLIDKWRDNALQTMNTEKDLKRDD